MLPSLAERIAAKPRRVLIAALVFVVLAAGIGGPVVGLLDALLERTFAEFRDGLRAATATVADPWQRLLGTGVAYMEFARSQPARYALLFGAPTRELDTTGMEPHAKPSAGTAAFDDLVTLILANLPDDDPRRADADTIAKGIWSGMHGFVTLCHSRPGMDWPSDAEFADRIARAWLASPAPPSQ